MMISRLVDQQKDPLMVILTKVATKMVHHVIMDHPIYPIWILVQKVSSRPSKISCMISLLLKQKNSNKISKDIGRKCGKQPGNWEKPRHLASPRIPGQPI